MPIHYELGDDHVVWITIDRPARTKQSRHGPLRAAARSVGPVRRRGRGLGRHSHGRRRRVLHRCGPEDLHPAGHRDAAAHEDRADRRDRRVPPRRRREGRAPGREDLQADHRRGERGLCRRRDGDARWLRPARRSARSDVRGHGAEARAVRRRRHDGAPAPPDPVPAGDGVPALRGPDPGGAVRSRWDC